MESIWVIETTTMVVVRMMMVVVVVRMVVLIMMVLVMLMKTLLRSEICYSFNERSTFLSRRSIYTRYVISLPDFAVICLASDVSFPIDEMYLFWFTPDDTCRWESVIGNLRY